MCTQLILILFLQIASMHTAPLRLQLFPFQQWALNPMQQMSINPLQMPMNEQQLPNRLQIPTQQQLLQMTMDAQQLMRPSAQQMQESQQASLQQQLLALQQLQALQELNRIQSPMALSLPPQMQLVLLPSPPNKEPAKENEAFKNADENITIDNDLNHNDDDKDLESIVIDAEPNEEIQPQRAVLLMPNGRLSIGDFISGIPWLPFEVNVPDSISWAYNGISSGIGSIIAIIGRPFRRPGQDAVQNQETSVKMLLKQLQMKKGNSMKPIYVLPVEGMMIPAQM